MEIRRARVVLHPSTKHLGAPVRNQVVAVNNTPAGIPATALIRVVGEMTECHCGAGIGGGAFFNDEICVYLRYVPDAFILM